VKLTIDLSKDLEGMLKELGIKDRSTLAEMEYPDSKRFLETEEGVFRTIYTPEKDAIITFFARSIAEFISLKYSEHEHSPDFYLRNPLWMLIENAWFWGNDGDASKSIGITCYFSREGFLLAIKDNGPGFNTRKVLADKHNGEDYFRRGGSAFHLMDEDQKYVCSYNAEGNESYMMYKARTEPAHSEKSE
jgi:hypothetical protein